MLLLQPFMKRTSFINFLFSIEIEFLFDVSLFDVSLFDVSLFDISLFDEKAIKKVKKKIINLIIQILNISKRNFKFLRIISF